MAPGRLAEQRAAGIPAVAQPGGSRGLRIVFCSAIIRSVKSWPGAADMDENSERPSHNALQIGKTLKLNPGNMANPGVKAEEGESVLIFRTLRP